MAATYTVKQVAEILGYSTNSIYTFLKEKRIKGVRLGKGRFRIPQSELDRVLHVHKAVQFPTSVIQPAEDVGAQIVAKNEGVMDAAEQSMTSLFAIGPVRIVLPNIFTWFIGISAIISGLSMYLYNQSFSVLNVGQMIPIVNAMRSILIGGGLGVLLTNMFDGAKTLWKKVFNFMLVFAGTVLTVVLWRSGDIDGMCIYGSLVVALTISTVTPIGGLASFSLYLTFLAVSAAVTPIIGMHDPHVVGFLGLLHLGQWQTSLILGIAGIAFTILLWWGYSRKRSLYWFCTWVAAVAYFALALWYADGQYWSRAFFLIMVGITSLFAAPWDSINSTRSRKEQMAAIAVYGTILCVLVVGIVVVAVMQMNVLETLKQENANKVVYARMSLEATLDGVQSTLQSVATNIDFVNAVGTKDTAELNAVSRVMFDSNHNIRRVVILDKEGNGVNLYPAGTFNQPNYAFRDYFIKARDTNAPFVSDLFIALSDQTPQNSVVISVPLTNRDHTFAGVVAASLNLAGISSRLQQIPVPNRGEYVSVVDSHGMRIVHPETSLIGTPSEQNDPQLLGIKGQRGIAQGTTYTGEQAMVVYDTIDGEHWGIAIKTPFASIYKLTNTATLIVLGVVLAGVVLATFFLQGVSMHLSFKRKEDENSP